MAVGDIEIRARRFVIATGSTPALPPIPGLDQSPYLTNESIFDPSVLPKHLIVIGAGPIGLELAQAFRRFGSDVTVLEAVAPLAKDDPECAAIVVDQLEREGVIIRAGVKIIRVDHAASVKVVLEGEETIEGTHLLVATGRKATTDGLGLEVAGIKYDATGVLVNNGLKTTNSRVYAIGDVAAGQLQFTHAANNHAGLVIRNALFRQPVRVNNDVIPWVDLYRAGIGAERTDRGRGAQARLQDSHFALAIS